MICRAIFCVEIGRDTGYEVRLAVEKLEPLQVHVHGVQVKITPRTSPAIQLIEEGESDSEKAHPALLTSLCAMVQREVDSDDPARDFDVRFRQPAVAALQRTMRHLRVVTDDPGIDAFLGTLRLLEVQAEDGNSLYEHQDDFDWAASKYILTHDDWQLVKQDVLDEKKEPRLDRELLLNARMFLQMRNYNIALVNAAIAAEMFLYQLVLRQLVHRNRVPYFNPQDRTKDNQYRLDLLLKHGVITQDQLDRLSETFRIRNEIVHWKRRDLIPHDQAELAISAARDMKLLLMMS
jgi:hypothetical protein